MNDVVFPAWTMTLLFVIIVLPWIELVRKFLTIHELRVDKSNLQSKIDMLEFHIRTLTHVEPYLPPQSPPPPPANTDPNIRLPG